MSSPFSQPAAPGGWGQPAPTTPAPDPWGQQPAAPAAPQGWGAPAAPAPAQQQWGAPAAPAGQRPPGAPDPYGDPLENGLRTAGLRNRLVLITPTRVERVTRKADNGGDIVKTRIIADVVVLDGPPVFEWRDHKDSERVIRIDEGPDGRPFNQADPSRGIPVAEVPDFWIEGAALVPQLEGMLRPGAKVRAAFGWLRKLEATGDKQGAWKLEGASRDPQARMAVDNYLAMKPAPFS